MARGAANKEAIAVNQAYAGHSGSAFKSSAVEVTLDDVDYAAVRKGMSVEEVAGVGPAIAPSFQYYYKPMEAAGAKTAVLLMNNGDGPADLTLSFADIPGVKCTKCHVRDIWAKKDLGDFDGAYVAKAVASHDAPFLVITPSAASPTAVAAA